MNEYRIVPEAGVDEAYAALRHDRIWNCFAIADLDPPFWQFTDIGVAYEGNNPTATAMVLDRPGLCVSSPSGAPDAAARLLSEIGPQETFLQFPVSHRGAVESVYHPSAGWQELLRMWTNELTFRAEPQDARIQPLTVDVADELAEFYGSMARGPFPGEQLVHGMFRAVRDQGKLVAVAGTHVMSPKYGVAVIGGVFTHPDFRRQGLAAAVTSAITLDLFGIGCAHVVLNVMADNSGAIRLYERLGYQTHSKFLAGSARRI